MAPSPELGQPKAPDKTSHADASKQNANDINPNPTSPTVLADSITNCGNNMTSTTNASSGNSSSNSCSGVSQEKSSRNIKHMNDDEFKGLLDEAYSYKTPKDRENKSDTFIELLDDVERTKDQFPVPESRYPRGSNNQHGGSLQDLKESGANDILDNDYNYSKSSRRHHPNWRPQKYSSVSTRQREGGSLPNNVNVSNCFLTNDALSEAGTKRRGKAERTFSGTSSNSGQESILSYESKDDSADHTTITEIDNLEDVSQGGNHNPVDIDVGVEVYATMNQKTTVEISCSEKSDGHWVDNTVSFPSLERSKANDATTCALPFDDSSKSCQSVLGEKPEKPKTAIFQSSKVIPQQLDENSNAIVTKKKKKFDADRNTTTVDLTGVEGYRGNDPIEKLVKFIENSDAAESTRKSDKFASVAGGGGGGGGGKKKDKKKDKDLKKDIHKVKKCSSLEELRSCTKLDEDDKLASGVIMRTKGKKNISIVPATATSPNEGKENIKQNTKRGERRSWGTEELTYLGENNAIEEVREKTKEKEKSRKAKEIAEKQVEKLEKFEKPEKTVPQKKKKSERSLSVLSMESAQSETAEFHVVTKKKRSKKRQSLEETRSTSGKVISSFSMQQNSSGQKKYQSSNSFSNDRDNYLSAFNPHDSRRKSTSSVPPSEKSDSSDLDSVHSLPIESVSNRHQSGGGSQMQHQSYADIARTVNANKNVMAWQASGANQKDKWPAVSASTVSNASNLVSVEAVVTTAPPSSTKNRSSSTKSKSLAKDFPDLATDRSSRASNSYDGASSCSSSSSTSTIVKQVGYLPSSADEKVIGDAALKVVGKPTSAATAATTSKLTDVVRGGENIKQTLQKSKSADNERFYSAEQYPALEKAVKRHSTQNSISDIKSLQNPSSGTVGIVFPAVNQVISNKQRSPPTSSVQIPQQQQTSTPMPRPACNDSPTGLLDVASLSSSNSVASASTSSATSALSDTSKIVINNNLDMNTNLAATSSSSSNNLGNVSSSTSSSIILANNGKKLKANTKACSESSAASLSEVNVKNPMKQSQQQPQIQKQMVSCAVSVDGSVESAVLQLVNIPTPSTNPKKAVKSESQQITSTVNSTVSRKSKRDKQHQNTSNNVSGDEFSVNQTQQSTMSSQLKHSNRPAVIILNDSSDSGMYGGNDFTFGDFNEEELRLFESNNHLDDSGGYNLSGPDVISSSSIVSDTAHEDIHLSPRSDQGYSSSNNRSIFSESMDQTNVSSTGTMPQKSLGLVYVAFDADVNTTSIQEGRRLSMNVSPFPNDSAIIMATTSSASMSSQFNSSSHLQPQSNIVVTTLGTNETYPQSLSSSSTGTKVLSNNFANSTNSNKVKESKINELSKYESSSVTNNDVMKNYKANSENVNISKIMNNTSANNKSNSINDTSATGKITSLSTSSSSLSSLTSNNNSVGGNETKPILENCTNNNYSNRSAAGTAATNLTSESSAKQQKSNCDMLKRMVNNGRKEINIRFVAPPITHDINTANYEKLVDFVGLAWEDILHGVNGETEYYDGQ